VKEAMSKDLSTWDEDYNDIVEEIRARLVRLATAHEGEYTAVLLQGSGTFCLEATITTAVPADGLLLVLINGAYGQRMLDIAKRCSIPCTSVDFGETSVPDPEVIDRVLDDNPAITHVAVVHLETTTGILNPLEDICRIVKQHDKVLLVDAISSFGGISMDAADLGIDFLISSANKNIQGVPGFGFVIAQKDRLAGCEGRARSLALDIFDQWQTMDAHHSKWRFTSPTHVVLAFRQALDELDAEGGIAARHDRYMQNRKMLVDGMRALGFETIIPDELQGMVIATFLEPESPTYDFKRFYDLLKQKGFVIYPGKVTSAKTFRVGHIGEVYPDDVVRLLDAIKASMFWLDG